MEEENKFRSDTYKALSIAVGKDKIPNEDKFNELLDNNKDFATDVHTALTKKLGPDKYPDYNKFTELIKKKGQTPIMLQPNQVQQEKSSEESSVSSKISKLPSPTNDVTPLTDASKMILPEEMGGNIALNDSPYKIVNERTIDVNNRITDLNKEIESSVYNPFIPSFFQEDPKERRAKLEKKRDELIKSLPRSVEENDLSIYSATHATDAPPVRKPKPFMMATTPGEIIRDNFKQEPPSVIEARYRAYLDTVSQGMLDEDERKELNLENKLSKLDEAIKKNGMVNIPIEMQNEYSLVKKQYDEVYSQRYSQIDEQIKDLDKTIQDYKDTPSYMSDKGKELQLERYYKAREELQRKKLPFFKQIEEAKQSVISQAASQGLDPQVLLNRLLQGKVHELESLDSEIKEKDTGRSISGLIDFIGDFYGISRNPIKDRRDELEGEIRSLSKITWLNKVPDMIDDNISFGRTGFSIISDISDLSVSKFKTGQEESKLIQQSINEVGIGAVVTPEVTSMLKEKAKEYEIGSPAFFVQTLAQTGEMLPALIASEIVIGSGLSQINKIYKSIQASKVTSTLASATSITGIANKATRITGLTARTVPGVTAKLAGATESGLASAGRLTEAANKTQSALAAIKAGDVVMRQLSRTEKAMRFAKNWVLPAVKRGSVYEMSSDVFAPKQEGELTFLAGVGASLFGQKAIQVIGKITGLKSTSSPIFRRMIETAGLALGEYTEENAEDFANAVNRFADHKDFNKFAEDLDANFGSLDVNARRFIASIAMSLTFQASGRIANGKVLSDAEARYNSLTAEQQLAVNDFLSGMSTQIDLIHAFDMNEDELTWYVNGLTDQHNIDLINIDKRINDLKNKIKTLTDPDQIAVTQQQLSELEKSKDSDKNMVIKETAKALNNLVSFFEAKEQTNPNHSISDRIQAMGLIDAIKKNKELIQAFNGNPVEVARLKGENANLEQELQGIYNQYEGLSEATRESPTTTLGLSFHSPANTTTSDQASVSPETVEAQVTEPASESTNNVTLGEKVDLESKTETNTYESDDKSSITYRKSKGFQVINDLLKKAGNILGTEVNFSAEENIAFTRTIDNDKGLLTVFTNGNSKVEIDGKEAVYFDKDGNKLDTSTQADSAISNTEAGTSITPASSIVSVDINTGISNSRNLGTQDSTQDTTTDSEVNTSNISNDEAGEIDVWNKEIETGESKLTKSKFNPDGTTTPEYNTQSEKLLNGVVDKIKSIKTEAEIEKLITDKRSHLNLNVKQRLAEDLFNQYDQKGDKENANKYLDIQAKLRSISGQQQRFMQTKTLRLKLRERAAELDKAAEDKKSSTDKNRKTIGENITETRSGVEQEIINAVDKSLLLPEVISIIEAEKKKINSELELLRSKIAEYEKLNQDTLSSVANSPEIDALVEKIAKKRSVKSASKAKISEALKEIEELKAANSKLGRQFNMATPFMVPLSGDSAKKLGNYVKIAQKYISIGITNLSILARELKDLSINDNDELSDKHINEIIKRAASPGNYNVWSKEKFDAKERLVKAFERQAKIASGEIEESENDSAIGEFMDRLVNNISKKQNKGANIDKESVIKEFLNNLDKYKVVFDETKTETNRLGISTDLDDILNLKFFNDALQKEFNKVNIKSAIEAFVNNQGFITSGKQREFIASEFTKFLLKNVDVTKEEAIAIKNKVAEMYDAKLKEYIEANAKKDGVTSQTYKANYNIWQKEKDNVVDKLTNIFLNPLTGDTQERSSIQEFAEKLLSNIRNEVRYKPEGKGIDGKTNMSLINDLLINADTYIEILDKTRSQVFGDEIAPYEIEDLFNTKLFKSRLSKAVTSVNFNELVKKHFNNLDQATVGLHTLLSRSMDFTPEASKRLFDLIHNEIKSQALVKAQQKVEQLLKSSGKVVGNKKRMIEKLAEMFNMGAFTNQNFLDYFHDIYGITTLDSKDEQRLRDFILISEHTEGQEKTKFLHNFQLYLDGLNENKRFSISEFIVGTMYHTTLSSPQTQVTIWRGAFLSFIESTIRLSWNNPEAMINLISGTRLRLESLSVKGIKIPWVKVYNKFMAEQKNFMPLAREMVRKGQSISNLMDNPTPNKGPWDTYYKKGAEELIELAKKGQLHKVLFVVAAAKPLGFLVRMIGVQNVYSEARAKELNFYVESYNKANNSGKKGSEFRALLENELRTSKTWEDKINYQFDQEQEMLMKLPQALQNEVISDRDSNYEKDRKRQIRDELRDQSTLRMSIDAAQESVFTGDPHGLILGGIYKILTNLQIKSDDNKWIKVMKMIGRVPFLFTKMPINFMQQSAEYFPAISLVKWGVGKLGAPIYRSTLKDENGNIVTNKKGDATDGFNKRTEKELLRIRTRGAIGTVVMGTFLAQLFKFRDDDDPEGSFVELDETKDWGITASGNGIDFDGMAQNRDVVGYQPYCLFYYDDKKVRHNIPYKDNPLGLCLAWIGEVSDDMRFRNNNLQAKDKKQHQLGEILQDATFNLYLFSSSQSFSGSLRDITKTLQIISGKEKHKKEVGLKMITDKANLIVSPGLYRSLYQSYESYKQTPMKVADAGMDQLFKDKPFLHEYLSGNEYDQLGYPIIRKFKTPFNITMIEGDMIENADYKLSNPDWQFINKFEGKSLLPPAPSLVIQIPVEGYKDKEYIMLHNNNKSMFQKMFGETLRAMINKAKSNEKADFSTKSEDETRQIIYSLHSIAAEYTRLKMKDYILKNRDAFDKEQNSGPLDGLWITKDVEDK